MGNPNALALGPGILKIADLGSTEPADLVSAWDAAWTDLGYTHEGSQFSYALATEDVEVAEELVPVKVVVTGRVTSLKFILAEITASNIKRAMNGGTITAGSGFVTFEPPALGAEVRKMLGWESNDAQERIVLRQVMNVGTVDVDRKKGAAKAGIPFEAKCEKPASVQEFIWIFASPARA